MKNHENLDLTPQTRYGLSAAWKTYKYTVFCSLASRPSRSAISVLLGSAGTCLEITENLF